MSCREGSQIEEEGESVAKTLYVANDMAANALLVQLQKVVVPRCKEIIAKQHAVATMTRKQKLEHMMYIVDTMIYCVAMQGKDN